MNKRLEITDELLNEINTKFNKTYKKDDLIAFDIELVNNDVDKDYEAFSENSLKEMVELFVGKTGFIFTDKKTQYNVRVLSTELFGDLDEVKLKYKKNRYGQTYVVLRAIVFAFKNKDLEEFDIKNSEFSISCSVLNRQCSICLKDNCIEHHKGITYPFRPSFYTVTNEIFPHNPINRCFYLLNGVTDVYEFANVLPCDNEMS